jgi:hypothetical protein
MKIKLIRLGLGVMATSMLLAQTGRPLSGEGVASAQVLGKWVKSDRQAFTLGGEIYQAGKWIDIKYGRPLLRGREAFPGTGAEYGKATYAGAPVWRAGANVSTRIKTEVPLMIGGRTISPGEYSLFIELKQPTEWTFIVSSWPAATRYDPSAVDALYGAFNYTPDRDLTRAPMKVESLPFRVEQLEWKFLDVTDQGGRMAVVWDHAMASVPFEIGN